MNLHWEMSAQGARRLRLEGEVSVEHAESLKAALLEGLESSQTLEIDCEKVTAMDFYAVQMLCSAHRTSVDRNRLLVFSGAPSQAVSQAIESSGFVRHRGCSLCPQSIRCLWLR